MATILKVDMIFDKDDIETIFIINDVKSIKDLHEKVYDRFPFLKGKNLRIYWIDSEEDEILLSHEEDFIILNEQNVHKLYVELIQNSRKLLNTDSSTVVPVETEIPVVINEKTAKILKVHFSEPSEDNYDISEQFEPTEHQGVICNNCKLGIFIYRYKCCECSDYDLCIDCESKAIHSNHTMIRISEPAKHGASEFRFIKET